jgi:hypothetical protein
MLMFYAEDYGGLASGDVETFIGACMALGQLVMCFITIPLGNFIDGARDIWPIVYYVVLGDVLCITMFILCPFLPISYRPLFLGTLVMIFSLVLQMFTLLIIPIFMGLASVTGKVQPAA